jgi:hypothetical protein
LIVVNQPNGKQERTLQMSGAAREVLVKAICQAMPTYSMSCFRLSKKKRVRGLQTLLQGFGGEKMK